MITALDLDETIDFVSQFDTAETKTVFKISAISSKIQARATRLIGEKGEGASEMMMEVFRFGVKGILNFVDARGVPLAFDTTTIPLGAETVPVVADSVMNRIHIKIILEVGARILELSNLQEQEQKN
jgi:hypothetical protein